MLGRERFDYTCITWKAKMNYLYAIKQLLESKGMGKI